MKRFSQIFFHSLAVNGFIFPVQNKLKEKKSALNNNVCNNSTHTQTKRMKQRTTPSKIEGDFRAMHRLWF